MQDCSCLCCVRTEDGPTGKRNDFEAAATHLLPHDPLAKKGLSGTLDHLIGDGHGRGG
jgi:hypothetical protein